MTWADRVSLFVVIASSLIVILFVRSKVRHRASDAVLALPSAEEMASFRYKEDWAAWYFERNPTEQGFDAELAWRDTGLVDRFGNWTTEELKRASLLARATGEPRAELEQEMARKHALEDELLACDNWEAWLRLYITAKPEADLFTVCKQMKDLGTSAASTAEREGAQARGNPPPAERVEALAAVLAPLGRLVTRQREARAREEALALEKLDPSAKRKRERRRAWLVEFQTNGGVHDEAIEAYYEAGLEQRLGEMDFVESLAWWSEAWRSLAARRRAQAAAARRERVVRPWTTPLDVASFRRALAQRGEVETPLARAAMASDLRALLAAKGAPPDLCKFLEEDFSFDESFAIGPIRMCSVTELHKENTLPFNDECLHAGLLVVASCKTDDPVVVDLETGAVGYIDHDELWTNGATPDPRALLIDTGLGVGRFFLAAAQHAQEFPADASQARAVAARFSTTFPLLS